MISHFLIFIRAVSEGLEFDTEFRTNAGTFGTSYGEGCIEGNEKKYLGFDCSIPAMCFIVS